MTEANAAKRSAQDAAAAPVREHDQDYVDTVNTTEGEGNRQEVRSNPSSALQEEAQGPREHTMREKSAVKSGVEGESVSRREGTLERARDSHRAPSASTSNIEYIPSATNTARSHTKLAPAATFSGTPAAVAAARLSPHLCHFDAFPCI
ncbi:hypothetical protein WOLCODRAFT_157483 [Wolfiporia cocos MD-104 SS10]|uniref:Uncharacterized protein n=1 Tax=Wolfiporia cocos (strain MD-104) TaxID=742152 RepID=A0A2H3JAF3_WOLCO|nr:hypothetical protein WOLCODRAFT_157483 [Wolfiporia cocos MD-104 SS10]